MAIPTLKSNYRYEPVLLTYIVRTILIAAAMTGVTPVCAADMPVVYRDDFSTATQVWPVGNWGDRIAGISDGMYHLRKLSPGGLWFIPAPQIFLDINADYDIELRLRFNSGQKDKIIGIGYMAADVNYVNVVGYTADGSLGAFRISSGRYEDVVTPVPSASVKQNNEWNTITVRRRGSAIAIVINDDITTYTEEPRLFGRAFGIVVTGSIAVEADYIEVRQTQQPIRLAADYPKDVVRENLGPNVNTYSGDLSPVITADGRQLYIGRYPYEGNIGHPSTEDIYVSDLQPDGLWGRMRNIGRPLNNEGSNFLISITPDGNTALVGNTYRPDGRPLSGGVSISYRTEGGWTVPREVIIRNYYNRNRFAEYSLSPSGQQLIMAIQRDDSKGDKDMYVSHLLSDGTFSAPQHIQTLSTWGNEMSPFVAADGVTMYYATDGLKGYGSMDIWVTRRLDDTWLNWTEPENMGPSVNSDKWDGYFTVPAKGDYAYLSAANNTDGSADIYRIRLTKGVRPQPVFLVRGHVLDAVTRKPIAARVAYESLTHRMAVGTARSALPEGSYSIALPSGDLYGFRAEAEGYYPVSDQLDARKLEEYTELERDLLLVPLRVNETIKLSNIFFDFGKSTLRDESLPELERLLALLRSRPSLVIELQGHTDNVGSDDANKALSKDRVEAVRTYLVNNGIDEKRLMAVGYGKSKPVASNDTEEGRQQNRRVEFKIVKM